MMSFAIFLTVCCVGVLYLLGFLLAIEHDLRRGRNRAAAKLEHVSSGYAKTADTASVLTLVHSNPLRRVSAARRASAASFDAREEQPQFKEAQG
jgi:hypothetical protein